MTRYNYTILDTETLPHRFQLTEGDSTFSHTFGSLREALAWIAFRHQDAEPGDPDLGFCEELCRYYHTVTVDVAD